MGRKGYGYEMSRALSRLGSVGVWPVIAFTAASVVSACGGSSTPGVLTQADIPSYLGVRSTSSTLGEIGAPLPRTHGCKATGVAIFTAPVRDAISALPNVAKSPAVLSAALSCPRATAAQGVVGAFVTGRDTRSVPGLGGRAKLVNLSRGGMDRDYEVIWRQGNEIGSVDLGGPPSDKRITPALVELLARRAAAGS